MYRWGDQAGSRGGATIEKFQSAVLTQTQKLQNVTASLKKVSSHVANTDKNNGLV